MAKEKVWKNANRLNMVKRQIYSLFLDIAQKGGVENRGIDHKKQPFLLVDGAKVTTFATPREAIVIPII